jgi:hypothetical protein
MRWFALAKINLITRPVLRYAAPHNTSLSEGIKDITGLASAFHIRLQVSTHFKKIL